MLSRIVYGMATHPPPAQKVLRLGRPGVSLKMGIVGMANIGKSSTFNLISKLNVPAENYPFCTIQPNTALIKIQDPRFEKLCEMFEPEKDVAPVLKVVDIAGLVKGASEGHGLGNEFLANITSVDGIYQVVRAFSNEDILHTEGKMDAVRDVEIIRDELVKKDLQVVSKRVEQLAGKANRAQNNHEIKLNYNTLLKVKDILKQGKEIRCHPWTSQDEVNVLNKYVFLTAKPIVYLINLSKDDFLSKKKLPFEDKLLEKISHAGKHPTKIIRYSVEYEMQEGPKPESQIDNIIHSGYELLEIIHFFTVGKDEVKAWAIRKNDTAVDAAGSIHTDFTKGFISAEVLHSDKLIANPKLMEKFEKSMKKQGKSYVVKDGDIIHFNCKFK